MKKDWTTTKLIAAGSLAVLTVVFQLFGAGITAVTGIPLAGGIINGFLSPATRMICLFAVDQFGAATIMGAILGLLNLPLPISGTPGFLPKVPIVIIGGVIADALYQALKRNKLIASLINGALVNVYGMLAFVKVGRLFNMPGVEQTAKLAYSPIAIVAILLMGAIGGYLGYVIYQKIKDTALVKRIQQ
jgi:hypothetical protein